MCELTLPCIVRFGVTESIDVFVPTPVPGIFQSRVGFNRSAFPSLVDFHRILDTHSEDFLLGTGKPF